MGRSKRNTGNWLVTYSDLVTLLLVFFVLLYMLTPGIDESVFDNFISYFQRSVGVIDQTSVLDEQSSSMEIYRIEVMERWQAIEEFLENHDLSSQVDIQGIPEGIKITLNDSLTFNSGSSELLPLARRVLEEIAGVFDDEIGETEVQGHTDTVQIAQGSPYKSNWHLGAARAVTVLQFISNRTELEPGAFSATSHGEYKPVANNETEEGRRQNRRVEIYVRYKRFMQQEVPAVPGPEFTSAVKR